MATAVFVGAATFWVWSDCAAGQSAPPAAAGLEHGGGVLLLLAAEIWLPWGMARLWADPFLYYTWPAWRAAGVACGRWGWPPASSTPSSIASPAARRRSPTRIRSRTTSAPSSPKGTARACWRKTPGK